MEVKVGIQHIAREITVDTDETAEKVQQAYLDALDGNDTLVLSDTKGGRTLLRASSIAYLDLGQEQARKVGFGSV
ncbi:DUF3107 domain-containing protein [Enemella evansiae]|uniref:ATP-binding protein n=1 Tax=Enemella evansiae TaxID=2016499 RepID=A0A255GF40_9ACTN|nr:DUF3107 domain-containing protein [Enemella evansiae]PFG67633.1 uncharacterized protein DUF3107 [Propionibacteriaceae bacterium ES.041]OYN94575.1 ATP-binding protein [Enemella evansiae]OYO01174.1 ATP-binding protein [Enemella evansiae]OYO05103.1 ATP-binding protein [Enemella evansiae]OYO07567.1 ATP-binding protein [Enemella evansiae]